MLVNPFQFMCMFSLFYVLVWMICEIIPTKKWIDVGGGIFYDEDYYWYIWLPARIEELEHGFTDWYNLEDLPNLKLVLERHTTGKDLG